MTTVIMRNYFNGEDTQTSVFAIAECTNEEAEAFCKRMNASRTSSYSDDYFVEEFSTYNKNALDFIAQGAEEVKAKIDEMNRR